MAVTFCQQLVPVTCYPMSDIFYFFPQVGFFFAPCWLHFYVFLVLGLFRIACMPSQAVTFFPSCRLRFPIIIGHFTYLISVTFCPRVGYVLPLASLPAQIIHFQLQFYLMPVTF